MKTTSLISEAIGICRNKPHTFVSTSATGVYGSRGDEMLYEESTTGSDYLANLCKDWEKEALKSAEYGVRVVCIRVGVVLDKKEGGFREMVRPFRFFAGGALGNGKQYLPWVHVNDIINIYKEAITNKSLKGLLNGTAPEPVTSNQFSKALGEVLKRPSLFKVPKFALKIIVGEFAEFLTGSQRVIPKKLTDSGFRFEFKEIKEALLNITD
ncbi:MAG: TIGR01777 family oxidoreductase [Ignavibacteriota bacterium]